MSQFPGGYQDPYGQAVMPPKKTSGLAIGGLVCSLVGVVPCVGWVTAPLGVLLSAIGVATTGPRAERKGRGIALAGLIIGIIVSVVWLWIGWKGVEFARGYGEFVMHGPQLTIQKGMSGDITGFQADFDGAGATLPPAEAQAFLDQLKSRYGTLVSVKFDEKGGPPPQGQPGQPAVPFPYVMEFTNQTVNAEVELIFANPQATSLSGMFMKKLGYIIIQDPVNGNLAYPSTAVLSGGASPRRGAPAAPQLPGANTTADDAGADAPINSDTGSDGG